MVSSSLTSFSWTSCRSHGFSEFSTALLAAWSMMDMMDVMDGGVMVAFLLIVEFVRAVTICRVWPSSSCYLLLASMLGQWVRAWSESGVSWVWLPCFCYLFSTNMFHKGENKMFQTYFRDVHCTLFQSNEMNVKSEDGWKFHGRPTWSQRPHHSTQNRHEWLFNSKKLDVGFCIHFLIIHLLTRSSFSRTRHIFLLPDFSKEISMDELRVVTFVGIPKVSDLLCSMGNHGIPWNTNINHTDPYRSIVIHRIPTG